MITLSDQDILLRLADTEDATVERKTAGDYRDCLKTAVAFANSLPVDDPGIIFVGVGNNGTVQDRLNLEDLQKNVSKELSKAYPPIYAQMKVIKDKVGREFLAVIVRGSKSRPHFAGPSYVRDGTQTSVASEEQFGRLVAERNSKVREILKWKGKSISVWWPNVAGSRHPATGSRSIQTVVDCNQFFVTLDSGGTQNALNAFLLSEMDVAYDYQRNCLELRVVI